MNNDLDNTLTSIWMSARNSAEAIEKIKAAFAEHSEWFLNLRKFELDGKPLMTGQEWLSRFKDELVCAIPQDPDEIMEWAILAAHKASGLDKNDS